jgi:HPt (histidine-containing phosphotransfer) domain-containing protein
MTKPYTFEQCTQLLLQWVAVPGRTDGLVEVDAATVEGLEALRSGGSGLYCKLAELFETGSVRALAELDAALGRRDYPGAGAVCHKLASSAANVGALAFARRVRRLEKICNEPDRDGLPALFEEIRSALPALIRELARLKLRASA